MRKTVKTQSMSFSVPEGKDIVKELDHVIAISGKGRQQVFDDWLEVVDCTLKEMPAHAETICQGGTLSDLVDSEETQAVFARLRESYQAYGHKVDVWPRAYEYFRTAFHLLLQSVEAAQLIGYHDLLGEIFMQWAMPSDWHGQFFTPFELARTMVQIVLAEQDVERLVHERVLQAARVDPLAVATLLASVLITDPDEARQHFLYSLLPAVLASPAFEPVTVCDPCCGSGVMFLAFADCIKPENQWMLTSGAIQFYGQDIDGTCVLMARINLHLHGLNGYGMRLHARVLRGLSERDEPVVPVVADPPTVDEAIQQGTAAHQANMFDMLLREDEMAVAADY